MNIQQLEYILAVDRFKNFTKAAEHCHVTQATLSAMIKKLEEELDVVLFDRKYNPVMTTEVGLTIVAEAREIVARSKMIKEAAKQEDEMLSGVARIGIIPTIASSLLPHFIKPFLKAHPHLQVELVELTTHQIVKQLKTNQIDLGILATPIPDVALEEEILYYETLVVYGRSVGKKKYMMPEEIQEHKIWLLEEGHCLREQFMNICSLRAKNLQPHRLQFESSSFDTLLRMVDTFGGLTLLPELYYQMLPKDQKKHIRFFTSPIPVREVSIVYERPYAKRRLIQTLAQFIRERIEPELMSATYKKSELLIAKM